MAEPAPNRCGTLRFTIGDIPLSCNGGPAHAHGHRAPGSWLLPSPFQSQHLVLAAQGRVYTGTSRRSGLLSVEATQAACIPQGRVPLVPLPPSRAHPCSPHTSVNTIIAQLVFLGTHSPLSTGRESRGPRGNRRAHRPGPGQHAQNTQSPSPSCICPRVPSLGSGPSRGPCGDSVRAARCKHQHGAARAQEMRSENTVKPKS